MEKKLFAELMESLEEAVEISKGLREPARVTVFTDAEVREIRERYHLSQEKFAAAMGISVDTLQNWEQGRRRPRGPAQMLLRLAQRYPREVMDIAEQMLEEREEDRAYAAELAAARKADKATPRGAAAKSRKGGGSRS